MNVDAIFQAISDGLLMGGVYALVAVGLTLIFGVMQIVNFAHGALLMLGMYVTYWIFTLWGINPYLTLIASMVFLFVLGLALQKVFLNPILKAPQHNQLLLTLGIMLVLENLALVLWTPDYRSIKVPWLEAGMEIGPMVLNTSKVLAFGFTLVVTSVLYYVLKRTELGKAIQATSQERDGAHLVGINVKRINGIAFGIGAACAGAAGTLILPFYFASPGVGQVFVLRAFVVAILGGLGNFGGALLGGLIIGLAESLSALLLPGSLKEMVIYMLFILILLIKPTGLFGGGTQ
ncbi:branched-chain amino acid ABC transporter permease [Clostridiales bacterium PH28_bin88]|nr:branched-chain amino acid ABC transporter permease [Clostridiales bacterium PH28_bin88]